MGARMSRQRTKDTAVEMAIRRALHRRGLRYRVHRRPLPNLRRQADIVFGPSKIAVFVDGCFWHRCPEHGTSPKANGAWWQAKLDRNQARDAETTARLSAEGWTVIRVWEHEDPEVAAQRIADAVQGWRTARRRMLSSSADKLRAWPGDPARRSRP